MTDAQKAPLLCRLRMHRWGITTYPIGVRWCQRCGIKGHDGAGYDPAMELLLRQLDKRDGGAA